MENDKSPNKKNQGTQFRKKFVATDEQGKKFFNWAKDSDGLFFDTLFGSSLDKFRIGRIFFCLAFSFVFSFLLSFELNLNPSVKLGEVANRSIRAPFDFEVVDRAATKVSQEKAVSQVPIVLDYYPYLYEVSLENIREVMLQLRHKLLEVEKGHEEDFIEEQRAYFNSELKVDLEESLFRWLLRNEFSVKIEKAVIKALENWSVSYIIDQKDLNEGVSGGFALVRTIGANGESIGEEQKLSLDTIESIANYIKVSVDTYTKDNFSKYDQSKIEQILRAFRKPNLSVNRTIFSQRKSEAREKVLPVVIPVKQNQIILREGSLVQEQDVLLVNEVVKLKNSLKKKAKALIITLLLTVILAVGISFLKKKFEVDLPKSKQDFLILFGISFISVVIVKICIFLFEGALYQKFGQQSVPYEIILLLSPFSMLAMLAALLIRTKALLLLYIVYASVGLSFLASDKFTFLIIALVAGMASVRAITVCKSRRDFYLAGLVSGAIIGLVALTVYAVKIEVFNEQSFQTLFIMFFASVVGGLLSSIFAVTLVPLFESFFDVMTDLKLLELSNLSHPLLKEMMVRAPGTYHHCMVVGSMCEAACNEIGVNGLQSKVMAYFHDVGKIEHAEYFVENQRKNINPHDNISPFLSKTIIIAHVKDGVELVLKHRLGRVIVAGVKEHHGTTLIKYFFNKAKEEGKIVSEEEFRYPGPKPQSKESAILMLADSIEAAARTIEEPSPLRIQNLIESMVDLKFSDGQLDDCRITFAELTIIKRVFYKVLIGVYHHRVDYPKDSKSEPKRSVKSKEVRTVSLQKLPDRK